MDLIRTALLLSVLTPVPPLAKPAAEVLLPRTPLLSLAQELDLAQKRLAAFVQPIAQSPVCGSSSFAELSVYNPQKRPDAGHLMGRRMPELSGLDSVADSGLWPSRADQDVAPAAIGVSRKAR